ncbi:hypothetical protein [Argonema antarcticum]|uniref:hypothetical protein n=1 Tax=Argonema antarcticum TaxID=2942763 RepID=UPI002012EAA1|nr:hypothetical protein [Argonema antarcticum]MCL1472140.1 hypothetical protein [Argonema antarcticum A004/B2]
MAKLPGETKTTIFNLLRHGFTMNQPKRLPDPEKLKRTHQRFQQTIYQLDMLNLKLDELNAMVEVDLRRQRLERLERRNKLVIASESKE